MGDAPVAVIGLGYFSQFHLAAWNATPGVRLAGVTDLEPERRAWAASRYAAQHFPDAESLLNATNPAIVDIVAPPPAHASLIGLAAAPGRIIVCQKPFCRDLAEARQVVAAAEAAGATVAVHENFRFQPWHRTIAAFLDAGRLGPVWQARFDLRPGDGRGPEAYSARQPAFRTMPRLLIHETGVHLIDLFRRFFGDITHVYADLRRLNSVIMGEDSGFLVLDHVGGTRSVFDGNRLADYRSDNPRRTMGELEIVGEAGTLTLDGAGQVAFRPFQSVEAEAVPLVAPVDDESFGGGCTAALIAHVAANIDTPARIENRAGDYLQVIAATEAAYRSAETGRKVALGDDARG